KRTDGPLTDRRHNRDRAQVPSAEAGSHGLAEAPGRLHHPRVRQIARAHLAEYVVHAGRPDRGRLLGDAVRRPVDRGGIERVADAGLVRDEGIVPRCQRLPKESHPGSPIGSQCSAVTEPWSWWFRPRAVGAETVACFLPILPGATSVMMLATLR